MEALEARPPYIRFERRPIERRKSAAEGGEVFYVDVDFALVTAHGSRDTTEKVVAEWFPYLKEMVRQGQFPAPWLVAYKEAFEAWKNDQEPPLHGTSIKMWPAATPSEVKILLDLRCLTIEDLAQANEELLTRIGMGARSLKQRAQDWLTAKGGHAPLVAQLDSLRHVVGGLENQLAALKEQNAALQIQLAQKSVVISNAIHDGLPPIEDRLAQAQASAERAGRSEDQLVSESLDDVLG